MEAPLAEPGQRLLARIADTLIVGVPVVIVVRALVSGHTVDVVAPSAVAACMLIYEAVQLALWGRTLGKRFAGIEVVVAPVGSEGQNLGATTADAAEEPQDGPTRAEAPAEDALRPTVGGRGAEAVAEASIAPEADETAAQRLPGSMPGPVDGRSRPGVLRCVLRAAIYSLPIAARPIPVLGLLGGIFWVANAGALYEGTRRQAVHDRATGTLVVKSPPADSTAF